MRKSQSLNFGRIIILFIGYKFSDGTKKNCIRHEAFGFIHVISLSKTSIFHLNKDIVGAWAISDAKRFHSFTTLCVKKLALS